MLHHLIEILSILTTSTICKAVATKAFFVFFATPGNLLTNMTKDDKEVIDTIDIIEGIQNREEAKEIALWALHDDFKKTTSQKSRNKTHLKNLQSLKREFLDFYFKSLKNTEKDIKINCDIHTKIAKYVLQIIRYRMVIEPEIQRTVNQHKKTQIKYLTAKGFWMNDEGVKERKFIKSIGRLDGFTNGKEDSSAIEESELKIQELLYEEYLNTYRKQ